MTKAIEHLENARNALLAFESVRAEEFLHEFEAEIRDRRLPRDAVARCSAELSAIRDLAGAACEGVSAAQRQLAEILKLSRNLDTYDSTGRRMIAQVGLEKTKRF